MASDSLTPEDIFPNDVFDSAEGARSYFENLHGNDPPPPLPLMPAACHDCAVECGFYRPYTESLAACDADLQLRAAQRWFCHSNPRRACRGNADALGLTWDEGVARRHRPQPRAQGGQREVRRGDRRRPSPSPRLIGRKAAP